MVANEVCCGRGGRRWVSVDCFPNYLQLLFQCDCTSDGWEWIHKIGLKAASSQSGKKINLDWNKLELKGLESSQKNRIVGITSGIQNQVLHLLKKLTVSPFLPSPSCAEKSSTWAARSRLVCEENASACKCGENMGEPVCLEYFEIRALLSHQTDVELGPLTL